MTKPILTHNAHAICSYTISFEGDAEKHIPYEGSIKTCMYAAIKDFIYENFYETKLISRTKLEDGSYKFDYETTSKPV